MGKKVHKLHTAIDDDIGLIGLSSDENDYRLAWLLNEKAGTSFARIDDLVLYHRKLELEQSFALFRYTDEDSLLTYRLIANRCENGYFLEDIRNLDYLIHIQGDVFPEELQKLLDLITKVPAVRMCVPVDLKRLKSSERLYLW